VEPLRAGQGRESFEGTSFRYDDFRVRKAAQYVFRGIERTKVDGRYFCVISAKPRYFARCQRAEFVVDVLDEARVVKLSLDRVPDRKQFSLVRIQQEAFALPVK
jgi:hypothetical protein